MDQFEWEIDLFEWEEALGIENKRKKNDKKS